YATAIAYHKKALAIREELSKRDPKNPEYRAHHAASLNNLGLTYKDAKKTRLAIEHFEKAIKVLHGGPASIKEIEAGSLRLVAWLKLGGVYLGQEKLRDAEEAYKKAVAIKGLSLATKGRDVDRQKLVGFVYFSQALLYSKTERPAEAIKAYKEALKLF